MPYQRLNPADYVTAEVRGFGLTERWYPARVIWCTRVTPAVECVAGAVAPSVPVRLTHAPAEQRRAGRLRLSG